jgi:hypothetical protein
MCLGKQMFYVQGRYNLLFSSLQPHGPLIHNLRINMLQVQHDREEILYESLIGSPVISKLLSLKMSR